MGTLVRINSKQTGDWISQHMWGGYDYKAGYLNVQEADLQGYHLARVKQVQEQLELKRQSLSGLYQKVSAGGYTRTESIYMDSEQAMAFTASLSDVAAI
ncbi:hypothetical protein ACVRXQ_06165 [Streptococcus panodentis]|uniref:hypothetical protein n=1 Tax=Streptococcus panodentis TaxID=1581472 RepID=UPI001FDA3F0A|nr:hypothetical protein [Streptococcus panodentis]